MKGKQTMKKMFSLALVCAAASLAAVDFDFTANPPVAKGKIPMVKLDPSRKIGGSAGRSALHFDGADKALSIPGTADFTLDKGVTLAFDGVLEKKTGSKGDLHMLFMKNREWLVGYSNKRFYINFTDGKKWQAGYYCNADLSQPHRYVITISPEQKIKIWRDGKLYHDGSMKKWGAKPAVGKSDVSLGCQWGHWGIKGDIFRVRIAKGVLPDAEIKGF